MVNWTDTQALAYIASYADLSVAFGADANAGRRHYENSGAAEGRSIKFEPFSYIASYRDLMTAFGADGAAGARHYIVTGSKEGRSISFDALVYIASYPDLIAAFGADSAAGARHYIVAGAKEGRSASFDAFSYIASYPDLMTAFGADSTAGARHYIVAGVKEGRVASFDAFSYIASYPDLIAAFGADSTAGARHYIVAGVKEGRAINFDALAYIASYPDLINAFGLDAKAGSRHFIQAGSAEGRAITFDSVAYLLSYPDLTAAGLSAGSALRHWIQYGNAEGRSAAGAFGNEQASHSFDSKSQITGAINVSGDKDWYKINLAAGDNVTIDMSGVSGGVISLRNASGLEIASGSQISFNAPQSGTFYLVVAANSNATGAYTLGSIPFYRSTGTFGDDTLTGTNGADILRGLDGSDMLDGRGGNDVLEGGSGYDRLNGGLGNDILYGNNVGNTGFDEYDSLTDDQGGNDQLYGQDGGDYLSVSRYSSIPASTVLLDGGAGDDNIDFYRSGGPIDTVTVIGGSGNDTINLSAVFKSTIDAGDGNDKVRIDMTGGNQTITLGTGADVLTLSSSSNVFAVGNPTRVTDFVTGTDKLSMDFYLANVLQGWDKVTNPFATGHLKLVQNGADTDLMLDRDGSAVNGYSFAKLLTFANTTATNFTANDLGYAPVASSSSNTAQSTFGFATSQKEPTSSDTMFNPTSPFDNLAPDTMTFKAVSAHVDLRFDVPMALEKQSAFDLFERIGYNEPVEVGIAPFGESNDQPWLAHSKLGFEAFI